MTVTQPTDKVATVVLVCDGEVIGALPPLRLPTPWWPQVHEVVAAVRAQHDLDITVLRLIETQPGLTAGGRVTYLAETRQSPSTTLAVWAGDALADHPLRQEWARPGGPDVLLAWARERLRQHGIEPVGPAQQMRTWNLSALWRLPTTSGPIWFKTVPDFFGHEGAVIDWIGPPVAPRVIDFAFGRTLLSELDHAENHDLAEPTQLRPMVSALTELQQRARTDVGTLLTLGVPDRRLRTWLDPLTTTVDAWSRQLDRDEREALTVLVEGLPDRLAKIEDCGVPDTLVHGDFHPGNVAGRATDYVILDWGDSFVGHPLLDELAFTRRLEPGVRRQAQRWFVEDWQRLQPGSDPARAIELLEPLSLLLAAVMYDRFCRNIEPDERVYHAGDRIAMLRRASAHLLSRPGAE